MSTGSFYVTPAYMESVSNVTATNSVLLGSVRMEAGEEYIYLYNDGGASITAGYGTIISLNSGYSVTVSSVSQVGAFIAFCKHATVPTANYFWGLTKGFILNASLANVSTAMALGAPVTVGANGQVALHTGAYTCAIQGFCTSACASGGTGASQPVIFVRTFGT